MALSIPTLATIRANVTAFFRNRLSGWDLSTESFLGKIAAVFALAALGLYAKIRSAYNDAVPSLDSTLDGLKRWAFVGGLSSNGGGYGANVAQAATGGAGTITGVAGTVFNTGDQLLASDGETTIELRAGVVIGGGGTVAGIFDAVTTGVAGNLDAGSVLTWVSPPAGADPTVILSGGLSGGEAAEDKSDLYNRILARFQTPPKGGAGPDYNTWCVEATDANGDLIGIDTGFVFALRSGSGSVDVVPLLDGTGASRIPSVDQATAIGDYIADLRPAAVEEVNVLRAADDAAEYLTIRVRGIPSAAKYDFDYDSSVSTRTVAAYNAGTPSITASGAMPADFITAVTNYIANNGDAPRLQVRTTGLVLPQQPRVVAYNAGTFVCTLDAALTTAPTVGDAIYAGGPVVTDVCQALLDYVDALGPSRDSGFADPSQDWEDTVAIWRLAQTALDVTDTDGVRVLKNLVSGGVTIAVGAGVAAATDYTPPDSPASTPGIAIAKFVNCTP